MRKRLKGYCEETGSITFGESHHGSKGYVELFIAFQGLIFNMVKNYNKV